ncbi:DNA-binding protein [Geodermatophilus sp. SYSU D01105]
MDDTPRPLPRSIGSPATRALTVIGVTDLRDLTGWTEGELLALHGVGPKAVSRLRDALAEHGLSFARTGAGR